MKRTNIVVDEKLLENATRASGAKTYSAAVTMGLEELIRKMKRSQIVNFEGSGLWEGDLADMRGDRPRRPRRAPKPH